MNFKFIKLVTTIVLLFSVMSGCIEDSKEGDSVYSELNSKEENLLYPERIIPENEEHNSATNEYISSFEKALEEEGWAKELWDEIIRKTSKFESEDIKENPEVQKEVAKIVFDVINREIKGEENIFNLSDVLRTKKADCVGYSQVYWIICKRLGLDVGIVPVYKDNQGEYRYGNGSHYCNVLTLSDGREILADLAYDEFDIKHQRVGNKFVSKEGVYSVVLNKFGALLHKSNKFSEAEEEVSEAIRINPEYAQAHYNLGLLLHDLNKFEEAEEEYREAIRIFPDYFNAHYNLGLLLENLNRFEEAEEEYREAIRINPGFTDAHNNLGILLYYLERYEEAEKEYREAIRLNHDYAEAHFNLGILLEDLNKFSEAEKEYRKAIRINPNDADSHTKLGVLLYDYLNKHQEAENELITAARLYREQEDYEMANEIEEVLKDL